MKGSFKEFIKNIIPVIAGILIALFINNWNENRKDKVYIDKFYSSLKKELEQTDKEITDKTPYQQSLVDSLDYYLDDDDVSLMDIIDKVQGVKEPGIKLNYWKALSNSKIELIDYEKLSILSDIEEGNELLKYKRNNLLDFIYSNMTETGKNEKLKMKFMMMEIMNTQMSTQEDIRKILNE